MKADSAIGVASADAPMTVAQRAAYDAIANGPRGSVPTPFLLMLDAPDLCDAIQAVGAAIRYGGSLSDVRRELAILATAGAVECAYEWEYHAPIAEHCGVSASVIAATLSDAAEGAGLDEESALIISLCRAAALRQEPRDLTDRAVKMLGRRDTTELIAIAGYYGLLAGFLKSAGPNIAMPT